MKKFYRILAMMFAILMVVSCFAGCKKEKGEDPEATTTVNAGETTLATTEAGSSLPDADWGGESYLILGHSTEVAEQFANFEIWRAEVTDDVVGKAVWERNNALADKYNFFVEQELVSDTAKKMIEIYDSGEDLYDLVIYRAKYASAHAEQEFLLDMSAIEYIDLTHPAWDQRSIEDLSIKGKLFFASSDFLLQDKNRTPLIYYNREMVRSTGKGYLEDMVVNNEWTVANFGALVKEFSVDQSGNNQLGDYALDSTGDNFGLACVGYSNFPTMMIGAGYRISKLDDAGNVTLTEDAEGTINLINSIGDYMFSTDYNVFAEDTKPLDWYGPQALFGNQKALFFCSALSDLDTGDAPLSLTMKFEYSFLPMPKSSAAQEAYYTTPCVHTGSVFAIPYTVTDTAQAGFFLQAITEMSTDTTFNAFYEVKSKIQDSQDDRAAAMLDLVFDGLVYDLAQIYDFGKLYSMFEQMAEFKMNRYAKWYPERRETAQDEIDTFMEKFAE